MKSVFATIAEDRAESYRPSPLAPVLQQHPALVRRLSRVASVIRTHFIPERGWRFRVHEGSLTFQYTPQPHRAVKVLMDSDTRLAERVRISPTPNRIVVGIELTAENPFYRACVRDYLARTFGEDYLDPRRPQTERLAIVLNDKYSVSPQIDHRYDLLFLPAGECPFEPDPVMTAAFEERILKALGTNTANR